MKITIAELSKKLKSGLSLQEIIDKDLNLIGNDDDVDSVEDVSSNSTTDSHVSADGQQNPRNYTRGFGGLGTIMEDENTENTPTNSIDGLKKDFPIISRNLEVLIDSIQRRDVTPQVYDAIVSEIFTVINPQHLSDELKQYLKHILN